MIGAIAGDIIGSVYEWDRIKTKDFPLFSPGCTFTDDSVLTISLADAILHDEIYGKKMKEYYRRYPDAGYGGVPPFIEEKVYGTTSFWERLSKNLHCV